VSSDPTIPAAFEQLVQALLGRTPADRPSSAAEVRDALRRLAYGVSFPGASTSMPLHAVPPKEDAGRANTMLASSSASLSLGTVSGSGESMDTEPDGVGPAPTAAHVSPLVERTSQLVEGMKKRPLVVVGGCAGVLAVLLTVVGVTVALSGDDEASAPTGATSSGSGGFSVGGIFRPAVQQVVGPPPEVRERMDTLSTGEDRRDRLDAARWLLDHEPASDVPEWARAVADLERARGCRGKKRLLPRIVELGDDDALPALERLARARQGCGFLGRSDCYGCLRDDLREAIEALGGDPDADG
jgi:hypothetical protein